MTDHWEGRALCAQVDPELFFPEKGSVEGRQAKAVCGRCEVKQECLDLALELHTATPWTVMGVWGGTTEADRRKMLRGDARRRNPAVQRRILALVARGLSATEAGRLLGVHYRTACRIVKEASAA